MDGIVNDLDDVIGEILEDPLLCDINKGFTRKGIEFLGKKEVSGEVEVCVKKIDGKTIRFTIPSSSTLADLKTAFELTVEETAQTTGRSIKLNWKYIWENFTFSILEDDLVSDNNLIWEPWDEPHEKEFELVRKIQRK